ncbi:MAG TPA: phage portal protein, partial [Gemmatimonadaceae bacterium]|nr:phage portal protein [Gemmatimonadaceae bacterium]
MASALVDRVQHRVQGFLQRMIGFNAGLPPGRTNERDNPLLAGAIPLRGETPGEYQHTGTTVRIRGFERHPVVMACVRAIVDIASAVALQAYRLRPDQEEAREIIEVMPKNAPLQFIMDQPSPFLSPMRLREITATHYLIYGNAFWNLERVPSRSPTATPKPPVAIRIIHPEDVMTVYVNDRGYPIWYLWRDTLGYTHSSPVTDIVHFRDLNAKGLVFGYPRAASALNDIIGDDEASQFVRQTVTNSGAPLSWALVHEDTTLSEAQAAEAAYYEKMVTRGNRGRFTFLGGVKDIKSTSFNLRDLEFPDLRRVSREDICASFGVDPRIVGIASASSDAGLSGVQYQEARIRLVQQTIEPMLRYFESELNFWFAPEYGDVYLRYDPDVLKALIEDDDRTSTRVRGEVAAGLRTIEEAREALDLPSDFELDDTLAVAASTQFVPAAIAVGGVLGTKEQILGPDGLPIPNPN